MYKKVDNFEEAYAFIMEHVAWAAAERLQIIAKYDSDGSYFISLRAGGREYFCARISNTIMCRYDTASGETVDVTYYK